MTNPEQAQIPEDLLPVYQSLIDEGELTGCTDTFTLGVFERLGRAEQQVASLTQERDALRVACGLILELHGCGASTCTEAEYLKDAADLQARVRELEGLLGEMLGAQFATKIADWSLRIEAALTPPAAEAPSTPESSR